MHKAQLWEAGRESALQMRGAQLPGSAPSPPPRMEANEPPHLRELV